MYLVVLIACGMNEL